MATPRSIWPFESAPDQMETGISRLTLLSPLFYVPMADRPFEYRKEEAEQLFCFELEEAQSRDFEPDEGKFFDNLIFAGKVSEDSPGSLELPAGKYLFVQKRENLSRKEVSALALEVQLEGLWQRLKLGRKLFLRCLSEDERPVTQIFRPYKE